MFEGVEFLPICCYYFVRHGVYMIAVRGKIVPTFLTDPFQLVQLYSVFPNILKGLFILSLLAIVAMLTQGEHQVTDRGTPYAWIRMPRASSLTSSHIGNSLSVETLSIGYRSFTHGWFTASHKS